MGRGQLTEDERDRIVAVFRRSGTVSAVYKETGHHHRKVAQVLDTVGIPRIRHIPRAEIRAEVAELDDRWGRGEIGLKDYCRALEQITAPIRSLFQHCPGPHECGTGLSQPAGNTYPQSTMNIEGKIAV